MMKWLQRITAAFLCLIGLSAVLMVVTPKPKLPSETMSPKEFCTFRMRDAPAAVEQEIKLKLKAPATAQFSGSEASLSNLGVDGTCNYIVTGNVDAQNAFGALLRSRFFGSVSYDKNGWRVIDTAFDRQNR